MAFDSPTPGHEAPSPPRFQASAIALVLFALTLAAYYPALNGRMQWDDASHITKPSLRGTGGLWRIWFEVGSTQQYYPVLHSAFWLEHRIWGDSLLGYHLVNVLLHATSACLFAVLLARINPGAPAGRGPGPPEWFAAAVFALHPVCVESVAWISEQKNTLSLVFYILAALAYMRFDRGRRVGWYALAFALFALALLSKSVTATLPGALLLALCWRNGRISLRRDVAPLAPWFMLGACAGIFTAWVERTYIGARGQAFDLGLVERFLLAGRIVWFYLGKLVWPFDLAFIYPRWSVSPTLPWGLGCLALAAAAASLYGIRRWSRAPLLALLFFVGSLLPVLGFVNVYPFLFSYVADHWQYLPCLGVVALAAEGASWLSRGLLGRFGAAGRVGARRAVAAAAAATAAVLFALTWRQSGLYRDPPTLYADTLAKNPGCWMAHNNLGVYLTEAGARAGAVSHLRRAVDLKPDYADAHNNLGNALSNEPGSTGEAIREFEAALRIEPAMVEAHANLGRIFAKIPGRKAEGIVHLQRVLQGHGDQPEYALLHADLAAALADVPGGLAGSIAEYERALRLKPDSVPALNGLGVALARAGRPGEAEARLRRALQVSPDSPDAHNNLGNVLTQQGRVAEAVGEYRRALLLNPDFTEAHINLGRSLRNAGDGGEAVAQYREALRSVPDSADVRNSLGSILLRQGRIDEALAEYREVVRLQPGSAAFRNNLGIALTQSGRLEDAIAEFRAAIERAPGFSDAHFNLGVALRETGRLEEAEAEFSASGRPRP